MGSAHMGWGGYYWTYVPWVDSSWNLRTSIKIIDWGVARRDAHVVGFGANKTEDDEAWQLGYQSGITRVQYESSVVSDTKVEF